MDKSITKRFVDGTTGAWPVQKSDVLKRLTLDDAMAALGIPLPPKGFKSHGFTRWGEKGRYWAVPKEGGYSFGDHVTAQKGCWFPLLPKATAVFDIETYKNECQKKQEDAAKLATQIWEKLDEPEPLRPTRIRSHPYLVAKQAGAFGIRMQEDRLIIPLRDTARTLLSLQFIKPDGNKRLLAGGKKYGSYHLLGTIESKKQCVLIAEGYATAATLHMATGLPVIMAVDASNIIPVLRYFNWEGRRQNMLIAGDNDQWGVANTGKIKAEEASKQFGYPYVLPQFTSDVINKIEASGGKKPTDWNDLHVLCGLQAVKEQLTPYLKS